ncbi:homeobox KN domain-containing protein [Calycina marina]|uniref:Homeobox KN domain-containing protein n=1 Tax=Calycina marina TaxID=1763456 RepID=A0A9P7Z7Q0_9HELO|nr:homeobox KN domain-containing protein [Calycina marina]
MVRNDRPAPPAYPRPQTHSLPPPQERIELPPIRQLLPGVFSSRSDQTEAAIRPESKSASPRMGINTLISPTTDESISQSLNKRRRVSNDGGQDLRLTDPSVPENTRSPQRFLSRENRGSERRSSSVSMTDSFSNMLNSSPQYSSHQRGSSMRHSPFHSPSSSRSDWNRTLPSLSSTIAFDRPEYALESSHIRGPALPLHRGNPSFATPAAPNQPPPFAYGYQQPRHQSASSSSTGPPVNNDRSPFSSNTQQPNFAGCGYSYAQEACDAAAPKDSRKRRGNLPKETTDKLRVWFMSHLQHPYPTEDEKQDLMRHTGLAMNQISNWFINARRRQLPTIVNNARVESHTRSAVAEGLAVEYGTKSNGTSTVDSDGDYDEDYAGTRRSSPGDRRT